MHAYRDQYAQLFRDGRNVVLIAISVDPADTLAAWARDDEFQYLFASDTGGVVGKTYGARNTKYGLDNRNLVAVLDVRRLERWLERLAQRAPGGPELQQHRSFPNVLPQVHRFPVKILQLRGGGPRSDGQADVLPHQGARDGERASRRQDQQSCRHRTCPICTK